MCLGRSGGFDASTPTPKLLLQELNDHNLMRHNQITAPSSQASSRDDEPVKSKPDPPRRSLSSRPATLGWFTHFVPSTFSSAVVIIGYYYVGYRL